MPLLTFGHGRLNRDDMSRLLFDAGVTRLVDVRRFPGSRANPDASRKSLDALMTGLGGEYVWEERLGGRRKLTASESADSPDTWWRVDAFRAYAAWTRSDDFADAMSTLVADTMGLSAVMCAESVWWRCHRRVIADVAVLAHNLPVEHLMHSGKGHQHRPSDGARLTASGRIVWDRHE
ncbi:MAG TPA: DUF488 domain-containing protein [Candidatus Stackebrandtia faecavium]|nr:DUF488 domain-containing protein [Candidatus Stackebrandtia faecavium]